MKIYLSANRELAIRVNNFAEKLKHELGCIITSTWHNHQNRMPSPKVILEQIGNSDLIILHGSVPGKESWLEIGNAYARYKKILVLTSKPDIGDLAEWMTDKVITAPSTMIGFIQENFGE